MANDGEKVTAMALATGLSRQTVYRVLKRCTVEPCNLGGAGGLSADTLR